MRTFNGGCDISLTSVVYFAENASLQGMKDFVINSNLLLIYCR